MTRKSNSVAYRLAALAGLAFGACGLVRAAAPAYASQAQTAQGHSPKPSPAHAASHAPAPTTAPSLLDHPAQPAKITLTAGKLTVQADNSLLADILHQVSKDSGMKIEGLDSGPAADRRMFGTYGPGTPHDVLSNLLSDSGYNFLMLGNTSSGAPRELALTARSGGAAPASTPHQNNPDEPVPAQQPDEPQNNPQPPPGPPEIQNRVRTPQQMLQDLQRMHERRQQQEQQQEQTQQDQEQQQDQPDQPDQPPDQQPE
jgi:hypothetical protein